MSPTVQMPLRLDRELYEQIRRTAKERGVSMAQVIREQLKGIRTESVPADHDAIKGVILDLLKTDADVINALKARADERKARKTVNV